MKKGFFFSQVESINIGPRKKIASQLQTFKKCGIDMELVESPFQLEGKIRGNFLLRQIVCRFPFTYVYSKHEYKDEYRKADVFYIRFLAGDSKFVKFIKKLKINNPNAIIIMELPDYPTTWYMDASLFYKIIYLPIRLKDILARRHYAKYIDRIALLESLDNAYGVPVISFRNGIDVDSIVVRQPSGTETIKLIAVAGMCNFHGYDRLIEGLYQYYMNGGIRKIEIHFVGGKKIPGNELIRYQNICEKYNLQNYITFHGELFGKELDEAYNNCNLAISSLGEYRRGYKSVDCTLKIGEYLAKGLPIVSGCPVNIFKEGNFQYNYECPNDDTAIDIEAIVEFFDRVYQQDEQEVIRQIRQYAEKYCDMTYTMKPIIDYINKGKENG